MLKLEILRFAQNDMDCRSAQNDMDCRSAQNDMDCRFAQNDKCSIFQTKYFNDQEMNLIL
jgi:hypothetical protein